MPNYGRSGRCLTCKRRRVKCDEAKPVCSPCRRLHLDCGGYTKNYTFRRDESHKFPPVAANLRTKTSTSGSKEDEEDEEEQDTLVRRCSAAATAATAAGEPGRSLLTGADVAVPFFLVHYAGMGRRSLTAARGFYETLIPMYTSQPNDSPLSLAVSAVATRIFSLWRHEGNAVQTDSRQPEAAAAYTQAVASLRSALEHPEEDHHRRPATALAVLALHLHESINAVYSARQAMPVHHQGALSMLPIASLDDSPDDLMIGTYVRGFVLHTEISSALRQKRSIHPTAYAYMNSPYTSSLVPGNLSSTLDSIGASVAELQADYVRELPRRRHPSSAPLLEQRCRIWITEAGRIDDLLQAWARDVPNQWRPFRLTSGQDFSPLIPAYRHACDIYPSCPIATVWNLWRFHRLLLLKMTIGARYISNTLPREGSADNDELLVPLTTQESAIQATSIQELVDGICHSIPFYLGSRTTQLSLSDFADRDIQFPSYHSLTSLGDARIAAQHQERGGDDGDNGIILSGDEHYRHMVAYGTWHALSPLSNLMTLVSDDYGGRLVASCLRPSQQEWIRQQFLRVSTLLRLPAAVGSLGGGEKGRSLSSPSPVGPTMSTDNMAESLAKQVRKGAMFMSGP